MGIRGSFPGNKAAGA